MTDMTANEAAGVSKSGGRSRHLVPTWLENLAELGWRVLVIVAFVIALAYLGSLIRNVVASIALAILVAVIMAPLVLKLRDGGRSRNKAAGIAWLVVIGVGLGLLLLLAVALLPYLVEIIDELQTGQAEVEEFGELLDIARFLLGRANTGEVDTPPWVADYDAFLARREAFIELIRDRLEPHLPIGEK